MLRIKNLWRKLMSEEIDSAIVEKFLAKVIEIEENPIFLKGAQESARREKIKNALDELCKQG